MTYLRLLRIHHWLKNGFIFIPSFFAGGIFHVQVLLHLLVGFFAFSAAASAVYVLNDLKDVKADSLHPKKSSRPLASGKVGKTQAVILIVILASASLLLGYWADGRIAAVLAAYMVMNVAYTFKLKEIAIVDICIIAFGFLLRIACGGIIADTSISKWLIIMTFLLALFLGLAKRRDDVLIFLKSGERMRKATHGYNLEFINSAMILMASVTMVAYIMYSVSQEVEARLGPHVYMSSFFVLLGVLRYLQIALVYQESGSPTQVLTRDRIIQLSMLGWAGFFSFLLYLPQLNGFFRLYFGG